MRKLLILFVLFSALALGGCWFDNTDNSTGSTDVNVAGTWHARVSFLTCSPASTCSASGFTAGTFANATMTLTQNGAHVEGTYTYDGSGVNADVSGSISGTQLSLSGDASNPLGRVTVNLTGTVANNAISSNISHDISLVDGRSGSVTASGNFTK